MSKLDIETLISQYGEILTSFFQHLSDMFFLMSVEESEAGELEFRYVLMNPAAMQVAHLTEEAYGKRIEDVYPAHKAAELSCMYKKAVQGGVPIHYTSEGDVIGESILSPCFQQGWRMHPCLFRHPRHHRTKKTGVQTGVPGLSRCVDGTAQSAFAPHPPEQRPCGSKSKRGHARRPLP